MEPASAQATNGMPAAAEAPEPPALGEAVMDKIEGILLTTGCRRVIIEQVKTRIQARQPCTQDDVATEAALSSSGLLSAWLREKCNTRPDVDAAMEVWLGTQPGDFFPLPCPHCSAEVASFQKHQPTCAQAAEAAAADPDPAADDALQTCPSCNKTSADFATGVPGLRSHIPICRKKKTPSSEIPSTEPQGIKLWDTINHKAVDGYERLNERELQNFLDRNRGIEVYNGQDLKPLPPRHRRHEQKTVDRMTQVARDLDQAGIFWLLDVVTPPSVPGASPCMKGLELLYQQIFELKPSEPLGAMLPVLLHCAPKLAPLLQDAHTVPASLVERLRLKGRFNTYALAALSLGYVMQLKNAQLTQAVLGNLEISPEEYWAKYDAIIDVLLQMVGDEVAPHMLQQARFGKSSEGSSDTSGKTTDAYLHTFGSNRRASALMALKAMCLSGEHAWRVVEKGGPRLVNCVRSQSEHKKTLEFKYSIELLTTLLIDPRSVQLMSTQGLVKVLNDKLASSAEKQPGRMGEESAHLVQMLRSVLRRFTKKEGGDEAKSSQLSSREPKEQPMECPFCGRTADSFPTGGPGLSRHMRLCPSNFGQSSAGGAVSSPMAEEEKLDACPRCGVELSAFVSGHRGLSAHIWQCKGDGGDRVKPAVEKDTESNISDVASRVRQEMEKRCLFQTQVASSAGISTSRLSEWLLGKVVSPDTEAKMESWISSLEPMHGEEGSCPHCGKKSESFQGGFTGLRIHIRQCNARRAGGDESEDEDECPVCHRDVNSFQSGARGLKTHIRQCSKTQGPEGGSGLPEAGLATAGQPMEEEPTDTHECFVRWCADTRPVLSSAKPLWPSTATPWSPALTAAQAAQLPAEFNLAAPANPASNGNPSEDVVMAAAPAEVALNTRVLDAAAALGNELCRMEQEEPDPTLDNTISSAKQMVIALNLAELHSEATLGLLKPLQENNANRLAVSTEALQWASKVASMAKDMGNLLREHTTEQEHWDAKTAEHHSKLEELSKKKLADDALMDTAEQSAEDKQLEALCAEEARLEEALGVVQAKIQAIRTKRAKADKGSLETAAELEELSSQTAELDANRKEGVQDEVLIRCVDEYLSLTSEVAREQWVQVLHLELQRCCELLHRDSALTAQQGPPPEDLSPSNTPKGVGVKSPRDVPKPQTPTIEQQAAHELPMVAGSSPLPPTTGELAEEAEVNPKRIKTEAAAATGSDATPDSKRRRVDELDGPGSSIPAEALGPSQPELVSATQAAKYLEQFKAISQDSALSTETRTLLDELMALCCNKLDRVRLSASRKRARQHQRSRTTDIMNCTEAAEWHPVPDWHAEAPERVAASIKLLTALASKAPAKVTLCDVSKPVSEEIVELVHAPSYLKRIKQRAQQARTEQRDCLKLVSGDSDTFVSENTYNAAMLASGAVCEAIDLVMAGGSTRNAFCCIRPPGHHAGRRGGALGECSQGFCLINNVCVGAVHSRVKHFIRKVCILDFDVHHGNGTEEIVRGDYDTLFLSVHRHGKAFYPTGCGQTQTSGSCINTALNEGFGSSEFRAAITKFIAHIDQFGPELILISAGFDAHYGDPIGGAALMEEDFYWATNEAIMAAERHCQGRIVSVLEGGYDIESLSSCIQAHVCALSGIPCPDKTRGQLPPDLVKKHENATCPHCGRRVEEFPTGLPGLSRHIRACPQAPARGGGASIGLNEDSCSRCGIKLSSFTSGLRGLAAHIWQCKGGFGADTQVSEPVLSPQLTPTSENTYRKDFEKISETEDETKLSCPYCARPGTSFKAAKRGLRAHIPQCPKNPHRVDPKLQPWMDQDRPLLDQKELIEKVKLLMVERGLTQDHVASVAGLTSSGLLSAWLREKCRSRSDVDEQMQVWVEIIEEQFGPSATNNSSECPHCEKTVGSFASGIMGLKAHVRQCRGREGMGARTQLRRVLISRVKATMAAREMTQDDVTQQAGLSSSGTISRWLRGLCKPDGEIDAKLEDWLAQHEGSEPVAVNSPSSKSAAASPCSSVHDEQRKRDEAAIKRLMQDKGYTQDDVASGAGLSSSGLLSAWLRDKCKNRPDVDTAMSAWLSTQDIPSDDAPENPASTALPQQLSSTEPASNGVPPVPGPSNPLEEKPEKGVEKVSKPKVPCAMSIRVQQEMEKRCLFQVDIAETVGISTSRLSEWLLGKVVSPDTEAKMESWISSLEPMHGEEGSCPHCGKKSESFQGGFTGLRIHVRQCPQKPKSPKRKATEELPCKPPDLASLEPPPPAAPIVIAHPMDTDTNPQTIHHTVDVAFWPISPVAEPTVLNVPTLMVVPEKLSSFPVLEHSEDRGASAGPEGVLLIMEDAPPEVLPATQPAEPTATAMDLSERPISTGHVSEDSEPLML